MSTLDWLPPTTTTPKLVLDCDTMRQGHSTTRVLGSVMKDLCSTVTKMVKVLPSYCFRKHCYSNGWTLDNIRIAYR